jgi:hypothetical protein
MEHHVEPQDPGPDWHRLRLVFMPERDTWYLVAIVRVEWTI